MIGKQLSEDLALGVSDLEPCLFTILTSVGGTEMAMGYCQHPLHFMFGIGYGSLFSHICFHCAMSDATSYDILLGHQALYSLGFGVDNWTK